MKNEPKRLIPDFVMERHYYLPEDRAADNKAIGWVCVGLLATLGLVLLALELFSH